jgi:hypothetical protein
MISCTVERGFVLGGKGATRGGTYKKQQDLLFYEAISYQQACPFYLAVIGYTHTIISFHQLLLDASSRHLYFIPTVVGWTSHP